MGIFETGIVFESITPDVVKANVAKPNNADRKGCFAIHVPSQENQQRRSQVTVTQVVQIGPHFLIGKVADHKNIWDEE